MSAQWYYDADGRIGGPISPMQLQLMVNSGMLQPHHKIRKETSANWTPAGAVRGLFPAAVAQVAQESPAEPETSAVSLAEPAAPLAEAEESPYQSEAMLAMEPANAFDF